jgi:Fe2+ transport system protein FeoA
MIKPLAELGVGRRAVVAKVRGTAEEACSLRDLGLHVGAEVMVLQGREGSSVMVAVADARIGVNFDLTKKILVNC